MSQNFFMRIANWIATDVVVKRLANSQTFQNFALRTAQTVESAQEKIIDSAIKGVKAPKAAKRAPGKSQTFFDHFSEEIAKDLGIKGAEPGARKVAAKAPVEYVSPREAARLARESAKGGK